MIFNTLRFAIILLLTGITFTNQTLAAPKAQESKTSPKGPTGLGSIKVLMKKDEIEHLQGSDGVHLVGSLTPYNPEGLGTYPGTEMFKGAIATPMSKDPLDAILIFRKDRLITLMIDIDSQETLTGIKGQIVEKYGKGKTKETTDEEQCVYKNGANFKLKSSKTNVTWLQKISAAESVETELSSTVANSCPSDLRYGDVTPITLHHLSISLLSKEKETTKKNTKNLF